MGKESHLRAERKRAHRQLERQTVSDILTPKRLSYLAVGAIAEAILTGCAANNTPPQQYELTLPPYVLDTFTQNIAVPTQFANQTDAINLVKCPPQIDISNSQLATVSVGFDPGSGFTFTLTPREGVEGMISVTAKVQAVGSDGSCVVAGIAQGSAEVDTKPTDCTQTGYEGKKALGTCNGGGSINVEGQTVPIQDGKFAATINDASHTANGTVNDGHGNVTSINLAIGAQCGVKGDMQLNAGGNGYQVPFACDSAANISTDLSGPAGSVGGVDQRINVAVRGGDGQQTTISAESHGFVTQTQFVAPTFGPEGNPQILVGGVFIREGKVILDNVTCQKVVLNAPCMVNGISIPNGQTADLPSGNALLGVGGQDLSVVVSDPAQRTSTYTVKQPPYNPLEAVKVYLNTLAGKTLSLHITSGDDTTESIANIKLSGHQNAPFSEGNWVHQIMEFFKSGDFECVVTAPAKQTWDASCALPYGPVLGQAGIIDKLTLFPTESNGATLPKQLDVYSLSAIQEAPERPHIPSTAELAVNMGGLAGLGVLGLGVAGMMGAGLKRAAEHAREGNLTDAMTILAEKASSDKFVIMNGTSSSNWEVAGYGDWMKMFLDGSVNPIFTVLKERIKGNDMRLIEDIPDWAKDYIREIWRRKQDVIVLAHRSTRVENRDVVTKPIFDAGTFLETVKGRGKKQREEEKFNETMTRLPKEQSEIRKMQVAVDKEWGEVIRDIWLKDLSVYIGENVYRKQTTEPTHLSHSVLYGEMPQLARYLLGELSEKSWLWKQINITNTNITRENLLAIFCAHLLNTGLKEYLDVKDWLKKELHVGKEVGREAVREIMKQRVLVYKS